MRFHPTSLRRAGFGLGLAGAPGLAAATAYAAAPPNPPVPHTVPQNQADREARRAAEREARLEGRLAFLKTRLGITAAQERQWNTFADSLRQLSSARLQDRQARRHERQQAREDRDDPPALTERLDRGADRLQKAQARLAAFSNAVRPLYAALSEDQKTVADRLLRGAGLERGRMMDRAMDRMRDRGGRDRFRGHGGRFDRDRDGPDGPPPDGPAPGQL
jgi:hypothetical protein